MEVRTSDASSSSFIRSARMLDWFHITMRLTVLQQQTKRLQQERPDTGADVAQQLESIKHLL
jgi:hypothetical protein